MLIVNIFLMLTDVTEVKCRPRRGKAHGGDLRFLRGDGPGSNRKLRLAPELQVSSDLSNPSFATQGAADGREIRIEGKGFAVR